jgi:CheY-like chemotaxis protein
VVDDVEEQRQIASEVFCRLGCTADCVDSGEAAVAFLKGHSVDLVVLDMLMAPGIDGLESFKRIVAFKPEQKVVIASGYSQPSDMKEAKRLGVLDYIMKPYTLQHISRVLHRVFP